MLEDAVVHRRHADEERAGAGVQGISNPVRAEAAMSFDAASCDEHVTELIDEASVVAQRNGDDGVHGRRGMEHRCVGLR